MKRTFLSVQMGCFHFFALHFTQGMLFGGLSARWSQNLNDKKNSYKDERFHSVMDFTITGLDLLFTVSECYRGGLVIMNGKYSLVENGNETKSFCSYLVLIWRKVFMYKKMK